MNRWLSVLAPLVAVAGVALAAPADVETHIDLLEPGRIAALTPAQSVAVAEQNLERMRGSYKDMQKEAAESLRKKDVLKNICVQDKLDKGRVALDVAVPAVKSVNDAVARGDDAGRQFQVERVAILGQKMQALDTEAHNCVGEDVSYVGQTAVEVEIDPNIPADDPTQAPIPLPEVTRPPDATPFV